MLMATSQDKPMLHMAVRMLAAVVLAPALLGTLGARPAMAAASSSKTPAAAVVVQQPQGSVSASYNDFADK
eukprot:CAMPEP_0202879928 /NCGR_PEP_ID=MMETSP1391-20130828/34315_1 /ASSEMBLY_ACC=CAM_ASM_000867 /TAXON_ID=1034604 /ORGANISM="Chlamydomonas leiostraca, Strain SAG 11-49" /LENGTH=70 /DNA_ID=CAMNT_0049562343 /DNA_START=151 /DNA_END=360 /DNA_ORIENTATION=+